MLCCLICEIVLFRIYIDGPLLRYILFDLSQLCQVNQLVNVVLPCVRFDEKYKQM